ncbi:hypothetical protein FXO37_27032 [Capsicum annuum]|nr:hypothetical protein FXO37_27032 [Capsicum annuum]
MTSKRGVIPSKRISYLDTPLKIKAAKRRRKDTSKASSRIKKSKIAMPLSLSYIDVDVIVDATIEEHNITVDNPSTASKEKDKVEPVSLGERKNYLFERDCSPFIAAYAEYLSDGLQVPNDGLDAGLLHKIYAAFLWKYGEAKDQKPYATDIKDPRRPKPNFVASDEEQLVHID